MTLVGDQTGSLGGERSPMPAGEVSEAGRSAPERRVSAEEWLRRWDAQQTRYISHREERFTAVVEALAAVVDRPDPTVLDLGCGPGSLSVRISDRLPAARLVALDADPLLLEIGRRSLAARSQITWVDADLRSPDWTHRLGSDGQLDAAVSSTALHWLQTSELTDLYATLGRLLRPGGVLIDADRLSDVASAPTVERAGRAVTAGLAVAPQVEGESWTDWWSAVEADPALAEAVEERRRRAFEHPDDDAAPGLAVHLEALRAAGFAEVGTVWQRGSDRVLVAVR